jgi:hypothetical protein
MQRNLPLCYRLPEDGEHSPKHVAEVMYIVLVHILCAFLYI